MRELLISNQCTFQAPVFTCPMRDSQVTEGTAAHFEAKLMPVGDSKLRVDWLKDGRPIAASNRMSTLHDFGFVAFDLKYTRPDDTGVYTCRAVNQLGEAVINANLQARHKFTINQKGLSWVSGIEPESFVNG